jgi:predicted signal transduction protein with EAL and GGDEF domain
LGFEFPLIDRVGQISHIVWNIEYTESSSEYSAYDIELLGLDITKRVENEKLITKMAYHDFLTDLPNRVMLYERYGNQ